MVDTPWGAAESLRGRMLSPGPGTPAEDVTRNQRERLFGAMVVSVASRGYAATRVADLIELSGISRRSFYDLFPGKEECFVAVLEELLGMAARWAEAAEGEGEEGLRRWFEGLIRAAVAQPAATRLCLIEAFAAGPDAERRLEEALAAVEKRVQARATEIPGWAGAPAETVGALLGAAIEIVRTRLRRGEEAELPELGPPLMDLLLAYRPPPRPLRLGTRLPPGTPETLAGHDHEERALRAFAVVVAERGYPHATIDQIVKRASMSQTTFYANFENKHDLLMTAIDSAGAQIAAAVLPAFRRTRDWPAGVRAAYGALFNFLASRPALAHLIFVDLYAAGPEALARRDESLRTLAEVVDEGRQGSPQVPALATEAILGGVYALAYRQLREGAADSLPGLAPICAYLTLAPFVGAEAACEVANGHDRRSFADQIGETARERGQVLAVLNRLEHPVSVEEVSRELEMSSDRVEAHLRDLIEAETVQSTTSEGGLLYGIRLHRIGEPEWQKMSQAQRERVSAHIGYLVLEEATLSIRSKAFDRRHERFLSRVAGRVDERGWVELRDVFEDALDASLAVLGRSEERLRAAGEEGFPVRAVQATFEMPAGSGGEGPDREP